MKLRLAAFGWLLVLSADLMGCSRSAVQSCDPPGEVPFVRLESSLGCGLEGAGLMVLRTDADWVQHCSGPPSIDFAEEIVIGVFLEDDCAFSGCTSHAPLIQRVTRRSCRVEVQARGLKTAELGLCNACAHPFDMVVVAAEDASGLVELR